MKVYIAGPMRGHPELNFPAFHKAQRKLEKCGFEVYNPADPELPQDKPLSYYMRIHLPQLCGCDALYLLKGWQNSEGAQDEYLVGLWCGIYAFESLTKLKAYREEVTCRDENQGPNEG